MTESVYHHLQARVHRPYDAAYADKAARQAATVTADDVGKLHLQSDTGDLYRLVSQEGGVGTWKPVAPRGDSVRTVDAHGGGDFTSLSAALAAITDAASNKPYTILVFGVVAEADTVNAKSHINVQGMAGARLLVTLESAAPAVLFGSGVVDSTWRDLGIEAAGASADMVVEFSATTGSTVRMENVRLATSGAAETIEKNTTGASILLNVQTALGDEGFGNEVTGYLAAAHGDENTASGDYSLALGRFAVASVSGEAALGGGHTLNIGRRGELQRREFVLGAVTTNDTPTEMFTELGTTDRLVLPNHAAWTFEALIVGWKTSGAGTVAGYRVSGAIRRDATAGSTAIVGTVTEIVGTVIVTVLGEDDAAWDVTAEADKANGSLKFIVTGKSGMTVAWGADVRVIQVLKAVT